MDKFPDIVVLGHHGTGAHTVRVHHIPIPGETVIAWDSQLIKDGGKGSHQAIVINRLGGNSAFIGKMGSDKQSINAIRWLTDEGINIKHLLQAPDKQLQAGITMIDDDGVNSIVSVAGVSKTLTYQEVKLCIENFRNAKIFVTGFEIPINTALEGAKFAKNLGMFTILNPAPAPCEQIRTLEFIDVIIPNEIEAKSIADFDISSYINPLELSIRIKDKYHVGTVIITMGKNGIFGFDGTDSWIIESIPVKAIDTLGAGDAFIGSFTLALFNGKSISEAMEWGNIVAGLSVTRKGSIDSFPNLAEVEEFIKKIKYVRKKDTK